ncbi:hypothetical protein PXW73_28365, partial [Klebsiella pneumoniae]|uniref:hypothetical protein n=1 Tax=Klebsiella pneumoniae TaxID=573 RepID=UPI0023815101
LVSALDVIQENFRRRRSQRRVKFGHVFLLQKEASPKRGFERKKCLKGFFGIKRRRRGMWRRRTGRKFLYIQVQ